MEMTKEEKKVVRGFMFLSEKPILYVLNISESTTLGVDLEAAVDKYGLAAYAAKPNTGVSAICGKVEAELADMSDEEAAEFLGSYGLTESGLARLIRKSYELLGLISFSPWAKTSAAPGPSRNIPAHRTPPERSTPICRSTSSAPKPYTGTPCSNSAPRPRRAPPASCGWKAKTTSCRTATYCTSGIAASRCIPSH